MRAAKKGLESHPERLTYFIIMSFIKPGQAKGMYAGEYLSRIKPNPAKPEMNIEN